MSIEIADHFSVQAPIERVWDFMLDPDAVVRCMPGAALDEIEDEETFLGSVKVKIGPIVTNYKGRVRFLERDPISHVIRLSAEGRDSGGGTARGEMSSALTDAADGSTDIEVTASVVLTGRVMQFGRSIHEGVARQLFAEFQKRITEHLETAGSQQERAEPGADSDALPIASLAASAAASAITSPLRKLLGKTEADDSPPASTIEGDQE
ncbi:MAG TPA: SRPBCC family protein [Acidobacteriota bacterium]|nr:SRPBCC family protein [Acidobacteriota bacterium]